MEVRQYTVLADYIAADGTATHVLLDIEVKSSMHLEAVLNHWIMTELGGQLTDYVVLVYAW